MDQVASLQRELDAATGAHAASIGEQRAIESQANIVQMALEDRCDELDAVKAALADTQAELDAVKSALADTQAELEASVAELQAVQFELDEAHGLYAFEMREVDVELSSPGIKQADKQQLLEVKQKMLQTQQTLHQWREDRELQSAQKRAAGGNSAGTTPAYLSPSPVHQRTRSTAEFSGWLKFIGVAGVPKITLVLRKQAIGSLDDLVALRAADRDRAIGALAAAGVATGDVAKVMRGLNTLPDFRAFQASRMALSGPAKLPSTVIRTPDGFVGRQVMPRASPSSAAAMPTVDRTAL